MKSISKRALSFILALVLFLGTIPYSVMAKSPESEGSSNSIKENYPLVEAFLDGKVDTAKDIQRRVYILEFEKGKRDTIIAKLNQIEGLKIKYSYNSLFDGVSVEISTDTLEKVKEIDGIKNIQENGTFVPQNLNARDMTKVNEAVKYAEEVRDEKLDGRGTVVAVIDSGMDINHPAMKIDDDAKPFVKIKENKIQKGFTLKVPHGFNYLGGSFDLMERTPRAHGMHVSGIVAANSEDFKGVAPNAQLFMYRIFSDRTFPIKDKEGEWTQDYAQFEYGGDDAVYHAMEDAVNNGADVISMSIGQAGNGYVGDIYYKAVRNAAEKGVVVVSAIGNYSSSASGDTYGFYPDNNAKLIDNSAMTYIASVGEGLSVGSTTNNKVPLDTVKIGGTDFHHKYMGSDEDNKKFTKNQEYEFVFVGNGRKTAVKDLDLNGKVAVGLRGGGTIYDKFENAAEKGAVGYILINAPIYYSRDHYKQYPIMDYDTDKLTIDRINTSKMWITSIDGTQGDILREMIKKSPKQKVEFKEEKTLVSINKDTKISGFSGWGPNAELELKPEIVAPGENVYSTYHNGKYGLMSGTSMSTPHISGISAILKNKVTELINSGANYEGGRVKLNKILLMNTAEPLMDTANSSTESSPRRQGAGMVNAYDALRTNVLVTHNDKGAVELKEIQKNTVQFNLKIKNYSNEAQKFQVNFGPVLGETVKEMSKPNMADSARKYKDFEDEFENHTIYETRSKAIVDASINSNMEYVELKPKEEKNITVTLNTGKSKDEFVEGFIYLDAENPEKQPGLSIPYFGYKGDWNAGKIIDSPAWEADSIYKLTTVIATKEAHHDDSQGFIELGKDENGNIDPSKIAFSNKGIRAWDGVAARIIPLREARDLEVAIVDKDKKHVRTLSTSKYFRKFFGHFPLENKWQYDNKFLAPNPLLQWDGEVYVSRDGQSEDEEAYPGIMTPADEGQYYFRIRARVKENAPYQELYMPVRIDNTGPKMTMMPTFGSNTASFKINDEHGLAFVGASIDGKIIPVQKISDDEYKIENLDEHINNLTRSTLRIEAMDTAGNIMEDYNVDLNKNVAESTEESTSGSHKADTRPGALVYTELDDDTEAELRPELSKIMYNWREVNLSIEDISKSEDKIYFNTEFFNMPEGTKDYRMRLTSYNYGKNGYNPMTDISDLGTGGRVPSQHLEIQEGFNIINVTVYKKDNPDEILYSRGHIILLDSEAPEFKIDKSRIGRDDSNIFDSNEYIFTNSDTITIKGTVRDSNDNWSMYINGDNVASANLPGMMGDNEAEFNREISVKDGDLITLYAEDRHHNKTENLKYRVAFDNVLPTINVKNQTFNGSDVLDIEIKDDRSIADEAKIILVNGKPYESGSQLSKYGDEYIIQVIATDRAGNTSEKIIDASKKEDKEVQFPEIPAKKEAFDFSDLTDANAILQLPKGYSAEVLEKAKIEQVEGNKQVAKVKIRIKNEENIYKTREYTLPIKQAIYEEVEGVASGIKTEENLKAKKRPGRYGEKTLDIVLKKDKFLAEELRGIDVLFDLPEGVSAKLVEPIDANKVGKTLVKVEFTKDGNTYRQEYNIEILPIPDAKLIKLNVNEEELNNIANLFEIPEGIKVSLKSSENEGPNKKKIIVTISDSYGNKVEKEYTLNILKTPSTPTEKPSTPITPISKDEKLDSDSYYSDHTYSRMSGYRQPSKVSEVRAVENKKTTKESSKKENISVQLTDIDNHWAKDIILKAVERKIVSGYPDNTFRPDNPATRAEYVSILNRAFDLDDVAGDIKFKDVNKSDWYYKDVKKLVLNNIVKGRMEDEFSPNSNITREEVITMIVRYLKMKNIDITGNAAIEFKDADTISDWAIEDMKIAYSLGLIKGDEQGRVLPKKLATRAEIVQMIYNLEESLEK
ncbi:MAG: S8 family serine peptidase [Peptoniphilus sp.]|uniref:S8 family serine peptidase n=1 Tax=Peptoniphilus sp. TaxID=1971214 RepID=UPI002A760260|nr:S8 family serine peptidase [Peptoniphilus sp.]MDY2987260.1 S8 family serine peptidase [Peptoniphilus sp.]